MGEAIDLNGVRIFYEVGGEGPPVLMIMGLGAAHVGWHAQMRDFQARYRTVRFDHRGCGRSACPPGPYSIRGMAEDAVGLMAGLHIRRAHVCGVSMGGMVAQEVALGWPDRVGALVLASTYAAPSEEVRTIADAGARSFGDPFAALKRLTELSFSPEFLMRDGALLMQLLALGSPDGPNLAGLRAQAAGTLEHDTRARLGAIRAPTLVLTGDRDAFIPPRLSDELARLIPGATLSRIPGGTHGVNLESGPAWNRAVLEFLGAHDGLLAAEPVAGAATHSTPAARAGSASGSR